jgi:hypothetical protein
MDYSIYFKKNESILICPLCSIIVYKILPNSYIIHWGCYNIGVSSKKYTTEENWIEACLENGNRVLQFYKDSQVTNNKV